MARLPKTIASVPTKVLNVAWAVLKPFVRPPEFNHTIAVHLRRPGGFRDATEDVWVRLGQLEATLDAAVIKARAGRVSGSKLLDEDCVVVVKVQDADATFEAIAPVLRDTSIARGGYALKWYGDADDPSLNPVHVNW